MDCDVVVIGAGVVGLAVAAELSSISSSVFVLEKHDSFGQETSSRNSEVIHAGIYYPANTLKAKLCVQGSELLYEICGKNQVRFNRIGKLIVAVNKEEIGSLETLKAKGETNGVRNLVLLGKSEVEKMEPNVKAEAALYSPDTGIIDSHGLMRHYESKAAGQGTSFVYGCEVFGIQKISGGYRVSARDNTGENTLEAAVVVNCAGLHCEKIAQMAGMDTTASKRKIHFCKGEYFSVSPAKGRMVNRLVYPSPMEELTGLGIHVTKDLGGRAKLGPNAYYVNEIDYTMDNSNLENFFESARTFLPFLEKEDLAQDMTGIRPKLQGPGEKVRDFVIAHEAENGLPGFINLMGIESPGLTSSASIANLVAGMVKQALA